MSIVSRLGIDFYGSFFNSFISGGLTKSTSADYYTVNIYNNSQIEGSEIVILENVY